MFVGDYTRKLGANEKKVKLIHRNGNNISNYIVQIMAYQLLIYVLTAKSLHRHGMGLTSKKYLLQNSINQLGT